MISIFFIASVPVLEPLGRQKNYRERVSNGDLGGEPACRIERGPGGWFVTNGLGPDGNERVSASVKFPWSFVPDTNIKHVEGTREELDAALLLGASRQTLSTQLPRTEDGMRIDIDKALHKPAARARKPKSA